MFKWIITSLALAMMATIPGFATDLNAETVKIARYVFFFSLGLTLLFAIIGATIKRQRDDSWE